MATQDVVRCSACGADTTAPGYTYEVHQARWAIDGYRVGDSGEDERDESGDSVGGNVELFERLVYCGACGKMLDYETTVEMLDRADEADIA